MRLIEDRIEESPEKGGLTMDLRYDLILGATPSTGSFPALTTWEDLFLDFRNIGERSSPFELHRAVRFRIDSKISGARGVAIGAPAVETGDQAAWTSWGYRRTSESGRLAMSAEIELHPGIYAASEYGKFCQSTRRFLALLKDPVELRPGIE